MNRWRKRVEMASTRQRSMAGFALPRVALPLALVVIAFVALGAIGFNMRETNALGKFKTQLRAQGEKLTFEDLTPADISESERARMQLVATTSSLSQLNFCPGSLNLMVYVDSGRAQVAWKQEEPPWIQNAGPGVVHTWAEYEARITSAGETLAELRHKLLDPPPYWTSRTARKSSAIPNFVPVRLSAQWLAGEAIGSLHSGDLEKALQDLEALAGCAQVAREDYSLVSQMIRIAVSGLGLSASWEALQAPGWNDSQLARLQHAWEPIDLIDAVEKGFVAERAHGEETWARAHRMSGRQLRMTLPITGPTNVTLATVFTDHIQFPFYRLTYMDSDELFFLQCAQDSIQRIRSIKRGQPWIEFADGLSVGTTRIGGLNPIAGPFRHWVSIYSMPNFTRAVQHTVQNETLRQLTLAAIAIRRFQLRYGCLPSNLVILSPEFLAQPPFDPMCGGPLQYTLRADGVFTLYSTGKDGRDDGGERPFWFRGKYGLWEEPDAVWPEPGPKELSASTH